jgi:hypothetical protein
MHEGYLFFSLMWLGCWYFIFISDESVNIRWRGMIRLLVGICFAGLSIHIFSIHLNLFFIAALLWSFYQWRNWTNKELIRMTVAIFFIMIAFICIRIYSVLYPVWFIINWIYMAAAMLVVLSIIFLESTKRISILSVAIILGEAVYSGILYVYGFPVKEIGTFESLDLLLLTIAITIVLNKTHNLWTKRIPRRRVYHQQHVGLKGKGIR